MSRLTLGVFLVVIWILMWGELSIVNVLSGALVVGILFAVFPSDRAILPRRRIRPIALGHLLGYFLAELVLANVSVTRSVLGRRSSIHTARVTVPLCTDDPGLITLISTMTTLTPGSVIVDVERAPTILRVHSFGHGDPNQVRVTIRRLEELCILAIGDEDQLALLENRR